MTPDQRADMLSRQSLPGDLTKFESGTSAQDGAVDMIDIVEALALQSKKKSCRCRRKLAKPSIAKAIARIVDLGCPDVYVDDKAGPSPPEQKESC